MHVLKDHQDRIDLRQSLQLCREGFHRLLSLLLRLQFDGWIAAIIAQRQHFGQQGRVLAWCGA